MRFTGLTKCKLDSNGRIKLPPKVIDDLTNDGFDSQEIVLYCLPEGALALFSHQTWTLIRSKTDEETPDLLNDEGLRRRSRRIASNTDSQEISPQGRLTIPPLFREKLGFKEGEELIITGNERGYEIWSVQKWTQEMG
ncbi:MAG: hypothetical protein J6X55_17915 [Victivallales bacterium]|nr:hypothetical protein [Victivallales bacterium]